MTDRATGWAFVVAQILLLGTLILLPPGDDFDTPEWIDVAADVGFGSALHSSCWPQLRSDAR